MLINRASKFPTTNNKQVSQAIFMLNEMIEYKIMFIHCNDTAAALINSIVSSFRRNYRISMRVRLGNVLSSFYYLQIELVLMPENALFLVTVFPFVLLKELK